MGDAGAKEISVRVRKLVNQIAVGPKQTDFVIGIREAHAAVHIVRREPERGAVRVAEHREGEGADQQPRNREFIAAVVAHDDIRQLDVRARRIENLEVLGL
jgi:hypothetical protein